MTQTPQPTSAAAVQEETVHHKSARQRRGVTQARMQLNLPAMIDIVFQLLIYFIVTANFAIEEGVLTAILPEGAGQPAETLEPPPSSLDVVLGSVGDIGVDISLGRGGRVDSFTELYQEMRSLQHDPTANPAGMFEPDDPVIIRPGRDVRWQHVVNAFNTAVRARYENVNFAQPE